MGENFPFSDPKDLGLDYEGIRPKDNLSLGVGTLPEGKVELGGNGTSLMHSEEIVLNEKESQSLKACFEPKSESDFFDFFEKVREERKKFSWKVKSCLISIITDVEGISEKAFAAYDDAMERAAQIVQQPDVASIIKDHEKRNNRPELCAEVIYAKLK